MLPRDVSSVGTSSSASNPGWLRRPQVQSQTRGNRTLRSAGGSTEMDRVQTAMNANNDPSRTSGAKSSSPENVNFNYNYGSTGTTPTQRPAYAYSHSHSQSHSRSVERLQRVLEDANDEDDEGTPPAWAISNDVEGANGPGSIEPDRNDSDELDEQPDCELRQLSLFYSAYNLCIYITPSRLLSSRIPHIRSSAYYFLSTLRPLCSFTSNNKSQLPSPLSASGGPLQGSTPCGLTMVPLPFSPYPIIFSCLSDFASIHKNGVLSSQGPSKLPNNNNINNNPPFFTLCARSGIIKSCVFQYSRFALVFFSRP